MSGADSRETKIKRAIDHAYQKAIEGIPRALLFDKLRYTFKKDTNKDLATHIDEIVNKAERYRNIRDIVLGTPWNQIKNKLSNIIKDKED